MFGLPDSGKSLAIYRATWYNILINEDFREVVEDGIFEFAESGATAGGDDCVRI